MNKQDFRLFINNITESIDEDSLREKLSHFGDISSIEIKQRKNIIGNQTPAFAYINIKANYEDVQKCFKDFSTQKFKNVFIDISIAKESFMDRLKRERENSSVDDQKQNNTTSEFNAKQELINNLPKTVTNEGRLIPFKITRDSSVIKDTSKEKNVKPSLSISEQKRVNSILEKKKEYHSQKLLLQNALSRIDVKPNKKIIFNENEEENVGSHKGNTNEREKQKFQLFTEDDDNEINNQWFEVKEQFEGIKGQKLLKLQNRFKNDPRFSMDTRFIESDVSEENFEVEESENKNENNENERKVQMQILEQVLGKKIVPPKHPSFSKSNSKIISGMLRYNPDHENHLKYEMPPVSEKQSRKKKRANIELESSTNIEQNDEPQVSKEKFYKVTDNLKEALYTGQQFSILETFGDSYDNKQDCIEQNGTSIPKTKSKNESIINDNPFKYDSSSESEDDTQESKNEKNDINAAKISKPQKLWTESFFFKNDDYRLQEGLDFVKRLGADEPTDFVKLRRNIKEAVKAKYKNNQRKFNPFKKKLGGMKRIKIKRAMKR